MFEMTSKKVCRWAMRLSVLCACSVALWWTFVSNRRDTTDDRRGGSVIATRHPLIAEPVRTQTASPRRLKVETSPPKKTVFTSVDFFTVPMSGHSEFLPFVFSLLGCKTTSCTCKGGCEKQCPTFRTNCQYKPIESTSSNDETLNAVLLRHPARRLVFLYMSAIHKPWIDLGFPTNYSRIFQNQKISKPTLDEFVRFRCFDNAMTKLLSGVGAYECFRVTEATLAKAKETLRKFDFVGIKEHLRESALLLKQKFGKNSVAIGSVPTEIISPLLGSDHSQFCLSKEMWDFVEKSNYYDFQLYEFGFDIFRDRLCKSTNRCLPPQKQSTLFPHFSSPFLKSPRILAILHVPKAAGSAFVRVARHALGCDPTCWCTGMCYASCPYLINQCGHTEFVPDACGGHDEPVFTFTLLRNPLDRVVSAYKHAKTTKGNHCCGLPDRVTVKVDFSESSLNLTQFVVEPGVSNAMVKMLAGIRVDDVDARVNEETYEKARKRLKELSFVGIQEQYKESVQLFFHSLNKSAVPQSIDYNVHNAGSRQIRVDVTETDRRVIEKANAYDRRIYDEAKEMFYDRLCSAHIKCLESN